jgi:catechol 2,3-dioxygenase-like lactoylglutathione lyase family enzyme
MPGPIPLESVNHIARETDDVERSRRFYRDVLGFREVWRPDFDFDGAWLYNYGVMIHIIKGTTRTFPSEISTRADHVALHTNDIEAVERILQELDIPYKKNYVPKTNVTQVFFHDPDGNHIEVGTYPPVRELTT